MTRTSSAQLPGAGDLLDILSSESQRVAVRFDFLKTHPEIYDVYRLVARDADWVDTYETTALEDLARMAHRTTNYLCEAILSGRVSTEVLNQLFDKLAVGKSPESAEAIFVFGARGIARVAKATELYGEGVAPSIILSGKRPHFDKISPPEADQMREYAINHGVPTAAIITESESITLPDNVKRTLDVFEASGLQPHKIVIVASTYVMQRAMMEWYKFTPWDISVLPVSADESKLDDALRRDSWYKSELGVSLLLNEYAKMVLEHKMDLLRKENSGELS